MIVFTTVNASLKEPISEIELADILKSGKFSKVWSAHITAFFTDVPIEDIVRFAKFYKISLDQIKDYYEKYIKECYPNKELEDVFVF